MTMNCDENKFETIDSVSDFLSYSQKLCFEEGTNKGIAQERKRIVTILNKYIEKEKTPDGHFRVINTLINILDEVGLNE